MDGHDATLAVIDAVEAAGIDDMLVGSFSSNYGTWGDRGMDRPTVIDPMFAENLRDALAMTPEERFLAAARLSDYAISIALAGIRNSHPEAGEDEVLRILERRIALAERLERLEAARKETWYENH